MAEEAGRFWVRLDDVPEQGTEPPEDKSAPGRRRDLTSILAARTFGLSVHTIWPGQYNAKYHRHSHQVEFFAVLAGRGHAVIGQDSHAVRAGDCYYCPPGISHALHNTSELPLSALIFGTNDPQDACEYPPLPATLAEAPRRTALLTRIDDVAEENARFAGHPFGPRYVRPLGKALGVRGFEVDAQDIAPSAYNASRHRHSAMEEFFFVLSGSVVVLDEAREVALDRWSAYYAPPGRLHVVRNAGSKDARLLIFSDVTPSNDSVAYFDLKGNELPKPVPPS